MQASSPTACLIVIGNEILSGRTQDTNVAWIAKALNDTGIRLDEVRIIPDITETIIETVNASRPEFTYIFTTGGIGPTHDDITSDAIAKAFDVKLERNKEAEAILQRHYGQGKLNAARLKMAEIPAGASLILNPVSAAPGFKLENVFVLAGVPSIMQAMFEGLRHELKGGAKMLSKTLSAFITEGVIAERLAAIQEECPDVEIGSYPFMRQHRLGTSLVVRGTSSAALEDAHRRIKELLLSLTQEVAEEDWAA
jgi:molybdenum cofactor synthesis domain-containing protein